MSDITRKESQEMIVEYVCTQRGLGLVLPYEDYQIIGEWLDLSREPDDLFLILTDVLPRYYAQARRQRGGPPPSLGGVRRLVAEALRVRRANIAPV